MWRRTFKRWIRKAPVWVTLLILVVVLVWKGWNISAAQYRMSPDLRDVVNKGEGKVDVVVLLDFKLEAYHINFFQSQPGRVGKIQDREVLLKRVPVKSVESLARHYWISRLVLANESIK